MRQQNKRNDDLSETTIEQKRSLDGIYFFDPKEDFEDISALREEMYQELSIIRGGQALLLELGVQLGKFSIEERRFGAYYRYQGCVVGFASGYMVRKGVLMMVELFVSAAFRRIGIAGEMLEWILNLARSFEATALETTVLPGDAASKSLMESYGLKARAIVMSVELG